MEVLGGWEEKFEWVWEPGSVRGGVCEEEEEGEGDYIQTSPVSAIAMAELGV